MRERPILFNAAMVRAILAGTKTQTRRIVKPRPIAIRILSINGNHSGWFPVIDTDSCPYGQPGDRLWVKETWRTAWGFDGHAPRTIVYGSPIQYQADESEGFTDAWDSNESHDYGRVRQSIFMRQWMSRITLEIVSVRVERLNDISEADSRAEGIELTRASQLCGVTYRDYSQARRDPFEDFSSPIDSYRTLWESINGPGSWAANPWVWVVQFKRIGGAK